MTTANESDFEQLYDDEDEAFLRYAAARRRELAPSHITPAIDVVDTSWAQLGAVSSRGVLRSLQFWSRPTELDSLTSGSCDHVTGVGIWPACISLAAVLEQKYARSTSQLNVLELGAGVGVAGIALAKLGATVTLTDNDPAVLSLLQRNIQQNGVTARAKVAQLDWAQRESFSSCLDAKGPPLDLIIGADLVYGGPLHGELLLQTISQLLLLFGHPGTSVLLASGSRFRGTDEHAIFARAAAAQYALSSVEVEDEGEPWEDGIDCVELTQLRPGSLSASDA